MPEEPIHANIAQDFSRYTTLAVSNKDDIFEVAATLIAAIGEASTRAEAGARGTSYWSLLERIRELHIVLLELLLIEEPDVDERTRGLATSLGNSIDRLQSNIGDDQDDDRF